MGTKIWVAVCTYLAVAIVRKELRIEQSMYEILQILSTSPFEQIGLHELFLRNDLQILNTDVPQMALGLEI